MSSVILDCDLMRFPYSGLYTYCLNLGNSINAQLEQDGKKIIKMYVPSKEENVFEKSKYTITEKKWHKTFWKPFLKDCKVWHAPFQSGRIVPNRNRYPKTQVLLTIHDLNVLHEGKSLDEQKKGLARTQDLINKSDAIVCISEFVKSDVLQHCVVGETPIHVVYNGLQSVLQPSTDLLIGSYKPVRPFIFGLGYVNSKKNYHVLLPILVDNPDIELIISGRKDSIEYVNNMLLLAKKLKVDDRLHITGPVNDADKAWYLAHCMAFMHPSLAEGFGVPPLEAMGYGKPVFLSDKTSLPEVGGDTAFYFSSFEPDAVQQVFRDGMKKYEQSDMRGDLIKRNAFFSMEKCAKRYIEVYESLL